MLRSLLTCLFLTSVAAAGWTPPAHPDPSRILDEAMYADKDAGRKADALAKFEWFHQSAVGIRPSLYGVRLSFALMAWKDLAQDYPPAMQALKRVRDEAAEQVRKGREVGPSFQDFRAINECLEDGGETARLFLWLDANRPKLAREVYLTAQRPLIAARKYRVCSRYIEVSATDARLVRDLQSADMPRSWRREHFRQEAAVAVALLAINGRHEEAAWLAGKAQEEVGGGDFRRMLDRAKAGNMP